MLAVNHSALQNHIKRRCRTARGRGSPIQRLELLLLVLLLAAEVAMVGSRPSKVKAKPVWGVLPNHDQTVGCSSSSSNMG
jgi:hypothetical protein